MSEQKIQEVKKLRQDFWHHEKRKEYQLADEVLHTIVNHYLDELIEQAEQNEELTVALNNANKEILVLKNQIRRLKNELSNQSTIRNK